MTIAPGLCAQAFRDLPPAEVVALADHVGAAGVEWGDAHLRPGDVDAAATVAALGARAGIAAVGYQSDLGWHPDAGGGLRRQVDDACATARALGAATVVVGAEVGVTRDAAAADRARVRARTAAIADAAAARGLRLALEPRRDTLAHGADGVTGLIARLDRPNVRTCWQLDPDRPAGPALDDLRRVLPSLAHLHVVGPAVGGPTDADHGGDLLRSALRLADLLPLPGRATRYVVRRYERAPPFDRLARDVAGLHGWIGALGV